MSTYIPVGIPSSAPGPRADDQLAGGPLDEHHEPQGRRPAGPGHLEADDPTHLLIVHAPPAQTMGSG